MQRKDQIELERAKILKVYRSAIRLKYALMADEEIAYTLPEIEDQFNRAVAAGEPFQLEVGSVFE